MLTPRTLPTKSATVRFRLAGGAQPLILVPVEVNDQGPFDFILDTVSAKHDLNAYLECLKRDGTMTLVGAPPELPPVGAFPLIFRRRSLAGSLIGGIAETQEMLDFCAERGITSDIELIRMPQINDAYQRLVKGDVKYRFVIDMASLKSAA